jgi:DNA polymerase-3 subunit beta
MDLKVTQSNLNKALTLVARVATNKSTLPVLSNILLNVSGNQLKLSATNLDIAINTLVGAKVTKPGTLTVPARLLQDFVANLPDATIRLKQEENKLHITTDNHTSTINGIAADEFPVMPTINEGKTWKINAGQLRGALHQVVGAASGDEARPILTGLYFHTQEKKLYIAATDSYRLAEKKLATTAEETAFILPASAAHDTLRIITDASDTTEISVTHDTQQVRFETAETELVARLIEGEYPDYQKLLPSEFAVEATLPKADIVSIVKVSSLFARASAGSVMVRTNKEKGVVEIQSVASQIGENTASATAQVTDDGEITLNARFLLDAINALEGDTVTIGFNEKLQPVALRNPKQHDYIHIVMPLKS